VRPDALWKNLRKSSTLLRTLQIAGRVAQRTLAVSSFTGFPLPLSTVKITQSFR